MTEKPPKKLSKHIPLHIRKTMKEKPAPTYFEVKPSSGVLPPGETKHVWIRFMPREEVRPATAVFRSIGEGRGGGGDSQSVRTWRIGLLG